MTKDRPHSMKAIIRDALIAKGFRPTTPRDIEAMLDTIGGDKFSSDKIERMLRKVRGEEPIGAIPMRDETLDMEALDAEKRELVAFYRAKGQKIPPEIQARLEAMRKRAREQGGIEDGK